MRCNNLLPERRSNVNLMCNQCGGIYFLKAGLFNHMQSYRDVSYQYGITMIIHVKSTGKHVDRQRTHTTASKKVTCSSKSAANVERSARVLQVLKAIGDRRDI